MADHYRTKKVDKSKIRRNKEEVEKPKRRTVREDEIDDTPVGISRGRKPKDDIEDDVSALNNVRVIEVKRDSLIGSYVPGSVFRNGKFKFDPSPFAVESQRLNERVIEASVQRKSLDLFLSDPQQRMTYCVSGNPDDLKAKYFAAYLVAEHLKVAGDESKIEWVNLYGSGGNPVLDKASELTNPSMIVICNLTIASTHNKLEKARDLLERFPDVPRVVVCAGMDPISFMATRLYSPVNAIAYFNESLVKSKIQIL